MLGCVSLLHSENVFFFNNLSDNDILSLRLDFKNKENRLSKKEEKKKLILRSHFGYRIQALVYLAKAVLHFHVIPF